MPTYEFRCPKGHDFEKFYRSISSAPREAPCPVCGTMAERQLSAGAGLVFKGSGFYITDYGKDGKKPQAPAGAGPDKSATGSEAPPAKSDTAAPAKAGEAKPGEAKPGATTKPAVKPGKGTKASE